jgi:exosortase A
MSAVVTSRVHGDNRQALVALFLVLAAVLVAYRDTAVAMVSIWSRSDTFAHAFLVPPIALWLIWRRRGDLAKLEPRPCAWMLLLMIGLAFAWLLGDLALVNSLTQFAMTGLLVLAVPAVLGLQVAKVIFFPLGFLFFAVPIGDFLLPPMMDWTADFTVLAVRISGIPAFREGIQIVIPSGTWLVVEACSGVRFLISSFMVGTLFSYLNYRSVRRRWIFAAVSVGVPVLANWFRAYSIVMLGHLSNNTLAVGVDHLIYGWVFFGVVISSMFALGILWKEPAIDKPARTTEAATFAPGRVRAGAFWATALGASAVVLMPHLLLSSVGNASAGGAPQLARIESLSGGWQPTARPLVSWKPSFQGPSAETNSFFSADGRDVGLYIGYYRQQNYERKLVSSENQLVKSKDPLWAIAGLPEYDSVELEHEVLTVRSVVLHGADALRMQKKRLRAWQVYWVADRLTSSDPWAKVLAVVDRLRGRGDDAAVIVIYTVEDRPSDARAVLAAFARANLGVIVAQLHATRIGARASVAANSVLVRSRSAPE